MIFKTGTGSVRGACPRFVFAFVFSCFAVVVVVP
jgi:hypothetical protein